MKVKHKLLSDYQYTSVDKKIFVLKSGTILEDYNYQLKGESILIDKEVVDVNPQIFCLIDWKSELLIYIKSNKLPTPTILTKKLIPFIEEMVLSSVSQSTGVKLDESKLKELEEKETELFKEDQNLQRVKSSLDTREKMVKDKEDDIEVRLKRLEKRESEYKSDLSSLDKKEEELRERNRELIDLKLDLDYKLQDINERERNLDLNSLKSSQEIDEKYAELQSKIDNDLKSLSSKEKELEAKIKELSKREAEVEKRESEIEDKERNHQLTIEEFKSYSEEIVRLDREIKEWEGRNMKMRRLNPPPSAIL